MEGTADFEEVSREFLVRHIDSDPHAVIALAGVCEIEYSGGRVRIRYGKSRGWKVSRVALADRADQSLGS